MSNVFTCPRCGTPHGVPPGGVPEGAVCTRCGAPLREAAVSAGAPPPVLAPAEEAPPTVRPARPRWEDDEREPPPGGPAPPLPGSVKAAGIIWTVFGALILLGFAVQVLTVLSVAPPDQRGAIMGGTFCVGLLVALFAGGFIFVGMQTLTGTAKDTLGNGIGSIIFAVLIGGSATALLLAVSGGRASVGETGPVWVAVLVLGINGTAAVALLAAGVLVLVGRDGYLAHREARYPRRRRYYRR
jgi:hypothetical protein